MPLESWDKQILSTALIIPASWYFCFDYPNLYVISRKWKLKSNSVLFSILSINRWEEQLLLRYWFKGSFFLSS